MGLVFGVGIVVPFEFLSKEEMQTERNMSPRLCCNYICWGSHVQCCGEACCHA